jgi:hypothetical protein
MERGKVVAIITGAISVVLAIAYLVLVSLLDSRGLMQPAPQELSQARETLVAAIAPIPKANATSVRPSWLWPQV